MDDLFAAVNALDPGLVAELLSIEKYRKERKKWRCPACNTGALHQYTNGWHCHACREVSSNVDLAIAALSVTSPLDAAKGLAALAGLDPDSMSSVRYRPQARALERERRARAERAATQASRRLAPSSLLDHFVLGPRARDYLSGRGICLEVAERYGLVSIEGEGAWRAWRSRVSDEDMVSAGLRNPDKGRDLIYAFPLLVLRFGGELRLAPFAEARERMPIKYMSTRGGNPKCMYGEEEVREREPLYMTEGELNALSIASCGLRAVSCSGSGTWRHEWCDLVLTASQVTLVIDGDDAGDRFVERVRESVTARHGHRVWREKFRFIKCPKGKDANDLLGVGLLDLVLSSGGWDDMLADHLHARLAVAVWKQLRSVDVERIKLSTLDQYRAQLSKLCAWTGAPPALMSEWAARPEIAAESVQLVFEEEALPAEWRALTPLARLVRWFEGPVRRLECVGAPSTGAPTPDTRGRDSGP